MKLTAGEIAAAVGGTLLQGDPGTVLEHVALDSRTMQGADLFVPIRGEKNDGHRYMAGAFAAGAAASLTEEGLPEGLPAGACVIAADRTRAALQRLGSYMRDRYRGTVVGITGSVGKTSTREMVKLALSAGGTVTGTEKNLNSQLGVPVTLCHMDAQAERAVLEMGISMPGEMQCLAGIARPMAAVVTNIGISHLEYLGSRENIAREKMHIADYLGTEGTVILNGDDALLRTAGADARKLFFGFGPEADVQAGCVREDGCGQRFTVRLRGNGQLSPLEFECILPVTGRHHIYNALAAIAAAAVTGVDPEQAAAALRGFRCFAHRGEWKLAGNVKILDDCYNASPDSVRAALQTLCAEKITGKRAAFLADMKELGAQTAEAHREIGREAASLPVALYVLLGDATRETEQELLQAGKKVLRAESREDAVRLLRDNLQPGDAVLIKGSNSFGLDKAVESLCTQMS